VSVPCLEWLVLNEAKVKNHVDVRAIQTGKEKATKTGKWREKTKIFHSLFYKYTHNPHTQLIHYSHPSAMVGSKNTVIAHTGAYYEVLLKLLHNFSPMKTMQNSSGLNMRQ